MQVKEAGQQMAPGEQTGDIFSYFNEIGMIAQLSVTLLAKVLPDEVHPSHFFIVNHLVRHGDGKTPVSIAQAMQVTKATMSHSLHVLEKRGFIRTVPCAADARSKQVLLTDAGRAFQAQAIDAAVRTFGNLLSDGDRGIMAEALPGLVAIRRVLDAHRIPFAEERLQDGAGLHAGSGRLALKLSRTPPR